MSYTTVLKTSADYVSSLKRVRELTNNLSATLKHEVFAYRLGCVGVKGGVCCEGRCVWFEDNVCVGECV